ncbi:MAG: hypothetical protein CO186_09225 [Zetaproteobacteria bacterium CG_4_9_14_3_um_filter_49_83]|nr:MAG: hypothetical protein AUJ56_10940 [Zetaproteobacteria bacterium CG1_02_49_23]PIQ33538.1 MAG: hypothetical protein COW62_04900 [Zetaproteobacteria bacterium CG17_big_fil_post_rev_8_21_14_2_50_50_13]PIV29583.1 MAG: hypothetical protein COS35_11225 [Zetaproteobacteria bacterium CG02_land_8_20_14_3_00_50_9]PIY56366.1 MAG: hypothetical protein COZ00_04595 [Zetaproteobacteria bacterium CG_4_10_14_0_8_um_filter_49_80]PJA34763.1 MAG: hypothetical protein CO186_09225 [Zetaproteobacteria bacterium
MEASQLVESYTLPDIIQFWARERMVHEVLVARELAKGVLDEGLRLQSENPKYLNASNVLRRGPFVGYSKRSSVPVIIRSAVLDHLKLVADSKLDFSVCILRYEFVMRADFKNWLVHTGRQMPEFWYGEAERTTKIR